MTSEDEFSFGNLYMEFFEWSLSIKYLEEAYQLDSKSDRIKLSLGRTYLLSNMNLEKAEVLLESAAKQKKESTGVAFGNLGHLYLLKGDKTKAIDYYIKCIRTLKKEDDFIKKMGIDLKFVTKIGILEKDYLEIRDIVVHKNMSIDN